MDKSSDSGRLALFIVLVALVFLANIYLQAWLNPPPKKPVIAEKPAEVANSAAGQAKSSPQKKPSETGKPAGEKAKPAPAEAGGAKPKPDAKAKQKGPEKPAPPEPEIPDQWATLGSADPNSPYRMLVTLTNRGAAVERIELNSPQTRELEDRSGYFGEIAAGRVAAAGGGARVEVVGPGTPAATAGIKPGDIIRGIDGQTVQDPAALKDLLQKTRARQTIVVQLVRDGKPLSLPVPLGWRPLELVRPERLDLGRGDPVAANQVDPLSFLMTLDRVDNDKLSIDDRQSLEAELPGLNLRGGTWKISDRAEDRVTFTRVLPKWKLELAKTYRLAKVAQAAHGDVNARAYHLVLEVRIRNLDTQPHQVAYQLDGPTGLPIEGWWYASKVGLPGTGMSAVGLRDVVVSWDHGDPKMVSAMTLAADKPITPWEGQPMTYIGVDAQYFSAVLIPQMPEGEGSTVWFEQSRPLRVGPDVKMLENLRTKQLQKLVDTSFRLTSVAHDLKPADAIAQSFEIFAGPKRPELLSQYKLGSLVSYGWFTVVAELQRYVLHGFYFVFRNYGIAIVLLTVLVRLCIFPLSRKQALNTQKMQQLQPEIKKIQEKYKNNMEARNRAAQDLYKKHNFNPLSGCLVAFLQLPIFVALYRLLMVDVELRQAPLLTEWVRWASNLSSPDMLFDWSPFWHAIGWDGVNEGVGAPIPIVGGLLGMGPYFNLLPMIVLVLFLWQQKKMMPPATDDQAAMQQKVMKVMMVVMGLLFFKVASGLCLYFIASSLWGMGERKYLPKMTPPADGGEVAAVSRPSPPPRNPGNGPAGRRKNRDRRR
jgi:YidC/Oxa1 family membrane protein insertase